MKHIIFYGFVVLLSCTPFVLFSQEDDDLYQSVIMDSVTIQASKDDVSVKTFIDWMIKDQSFYTAFKNLRSASYAFKNQITVFDKNQAIAATYSSLAQQFYDYPCRNMIESDKSITGGFLDRHQEYVYYTAALYDRLFFTHGMVCVDSTSQVLTKTNRMEKNVLELKKLLFSPGSDAHIPLLGDKTAIFNTSMQPYYEYRILADSALGLSCFLFEVEVKPQFQDDKEHKTVIKKLQTWFDQDTRQIVKREYRLAGKTIAYSFDVTMHIDVISKNKKFFPSFIQYDGTWKVIGKKRENAKFTVEFYDFK